METSLIRILTWNIHKGIGGVDRRYSLDRIIESIRHYNPDIAMLQEVDDGVPRSRLHRQVDLLAEALSLEHSLFQTNVRLKLGGYGNAILSRFSFQSDWNISLKVPLKKNRRAIIAKLTVPAGDGHRTLIIGNTHLGLAGYERKKQLRMLMEADPLRHAHHDTPMILGGDMNDVYHSLDARLSRSGFQSTTRDAKTFPAFMPVRGLDRLYFRGNVKLDHSFVGHLALARRASDHLPVIADFRIG